MDYKGRTWGSGSFHRTGNSTSSARVSHGCALMIKGICLRTPVEKHSWYSWWSSLECIHRLKYDCSRNRCPSMLSMFLMLKMKTKYFFRSSEYFPHLHRFSPPNLGLSEVCTDLSHWWFIGQESEMSQPKGIFHYVRQLSLTVSSIWNNHLIKTKSFACLIIFEMSSTSWPSSCIGL